ncbi:MAG: AraC family transcriptional regulator [bacterium]|nr:AraC family transcriptional regulator [bacterium]
MNKLEFVLHKINTLYHIGIRVMNSKGNLITTPFESFNQQDPLCCNPSLSKELRLQYQNSKAICLLCDDDGFLYTIFKYEIHYVIIGPVSLERNIQHSNRAYLTRNKVQNTTLSIPYMNIRDLKEITSFVYGILTENYESQETLFENERENKAVEETIHKQLTEYLLNTSEEEKIHFSYQDEKRYADYIIRGEYDKLYAGMNEVSHIYTEESIGILSESQSKQTEYKNIAWITLMTRYAIMAGVSDTESYALSDVSLQTLSKAKTVLEMERIMNSCMKEYERLIKAAVSKQHVKSPYIDQCKQYIAKHILEKMTLQDIANDIGIHPVYLSRIFSEQMEMPISSYIMQEKIKVSCRLLKYSGKSIASIAEYMNMAPQSYFSRIFKKVMHQSPGQYQKEYLNKTFYES